MDMNMEEFCKFAYYVLYSNNDYRYIKTYYSSDKGIVLGILNWSGYDAINILNDIIAETGPFKAKLILGRPLYQQITGPYNSTCNGIDVSGQKDMCISKISTFLNTRESTRIQDDRVIHEINKYATITKSHGVTNIGIITFIIAHYLNWIPKMSEDIIATCRLFGKGNISLHDLSDKLNPIFNQYGDAGKKSKKLFQTVTYYMDTGEVV